MDDFLIIGIDWPAQPMIKLQKLMELHRKPAQSKKTGSAVPVLPFATLVFALFLPAGLFAQTPARIGGAMAYSERQIGSQFIRDYTFPVYLPLEATLGRLYLTGSMEYARKSAEMGGQAVHAEGVNFLNMEGRFRAIDAGGLQLTLSEVAGYSAARPDPTLPPEARLLDGYRMSTGLSLAYRFEHLNMEMRGQHTLHRPRSDFRPGDVWTGGVSMGYGFGAYDGHGWPVNVQLGMTGRQYHADRLDGEEIAGSRYGTLFFSPALMFYGRSFLFEAGLDFPVRHMSAEDSIYRDRVRANIGLKYYLD